MKKKWIVLIAIAFVLLIAGGSSVGKFNQIVTLNENVKAAWAQVENVYQRRADLVPNLVETVKGAAAFEKGTFTAVTEARAKVGQISAEALQNATSDPAAFARFEQAQGALSSALSRLMVVVEKYPDLKATENFRDLQTQIEGTENRIAVERRNYNQVVNDYNAFVRRFPNNIVAMICGYARENVYFKADEAAKTAPEVKFN